VLRFSVQRWTDDTFATPAECLYGAAAGNACTFDAAAKTLGALAAAHGRPARRLGVGHGLAAGAARYITVGLEFPAPADNSVQDQATLRSSTGTWLGRRVHLPPTLVVRVTVPDGRQCARGVNQRPEARSVRASG
jgi:hypothetical protein